MKKLTKKFLTPFGGRNAGSSLIEVMIAAGITLAGFSAASSFIGKSTKHVTTRLVSQKAKALEPVVRQLLRNSMLQAWNGNGDACDVDRKTGAAFFQHGKFKEHYIMTDLKVGTAAVSTFFDGQKPGEWQQAETYCQMHKHNKFCSIIEYKPLVAHGTQSKAANIMGLAVFEVDPYNFQKRKVESIDGCDSGEFFKIEQTSEKYIGHGYRGKYLLWTATKHMKNTGSAGSGETTIKLSVSKSSVFLTDEKEMLMSSGPGGQEQNAMSACHHKRCRYEIPPNPTLNPAGYNSYRQSSGARSASNCKKCERARTYK